MDNWLNVEFFCEFGERRPRPTVDAAFTMPELRSLVRWLRKMLDRDLEVRDLFMGIEPNLSIRLCGYSDRAVTLEIELEQAWHLNPPGAGSLEITVSRHRLKQFSDGLETNLRDLAAGRTASLHRPEVWGRRPRLP